MLANVYVPEIQRVTDPDRLWAIIEANSFASLISAADDGAPFSTQVPFLPKRDRLLVHLAAENPQVPGLDDGNPVFCQFLGPHAYISPSWYSKQHKVPTWDFIQVGVAGRARKLGADETLAVVRETVELHESKRTEPLDFAGMAGTAERLLSGVRAYEIEIARIDGRFKLSRDKTSEERARIVAELRAQGSDLERGIAQQIDDAV